MNNIIKIMATLNDIEYGFKDNLGNNIIINSNKWDNEFNDFYYLQEPEELLKTKCGVCWDQVELERKLFLNIKIKCNTYFIFAKVGEELPSHTFLIYAMNDKFYWFEHSWNKYKGIHEYNNLNDLLKDVISKFKKENNLIKNANLFLYEYQKPKKHIKCNEFYKYIETQKEIEIDML